MAAVPFRAHTAVHTVHERAACSQLRPDSASVHRGLRSTLTDPVPAVRAAAALGPAGTGRGVDVLPHEPSRWDLGILLVALSPSLPSTTHPDPALAGDLLPHVPTATLAGHRAQTISVTRRSTPRDRPS
ncbi:hypothetical protein AB0D63_28805 [Kitasatospora sp. NPDC048343]|uniref:hypothetical protein n=1 Tax=Kitasatospora sp. NPDC048343 TaxID=3154717 RepID=UPI0033EEA91E